MNRRLAVAALFSLVSATAFAADTQRYVVAYKSNGIRPQPHALIREVEAAPRVRDVVPFSLIDGFATNLTASEAAALKRSGAVRYVEPVVERHALGIPPIGSDATSRNLSGQTIPAGLDLIRAREVWGVSRGELVNVVVVDTGIDYLHPDLAPNYAGGWNILGKTPDPKDDNGHGTHVAGTIAAADNDYGVVGVAPGVRLWAVKVLNASGSGLTDNIIAGLEWIVKKKRSEGGRWVVNFSLGSSDKNLAEMDAFTKAADEGLILVAATGNESVNGSPAAVNYPAAYRGVIAVGAVDDALALAGFSNQGPEVAVVAPGVDTLSSVRVGTGATAGLQSGNTSYYATVVTGSKRGTVTGEIVACGLGRPGDFPPSVNGRIALIQRGGDITFAAKAREAKGAGAIAVVIYNNDETNMSWTLISDEDPVSGSYPWPLTLGISKADGQKLLATGGTVTVANRIDDYGTKSGTSMATPHVAGVAALLWRAAPNATAAEIRQAISSAAADLGPKGFDPLFGYGLVDSLSAARQLAPAAFGNPATPEPQTPGSVPSGRRALRRGGA